MLAWRGPVPSEKSQPWPALIKAKFVVVAFVLEASTIRRFVIVDVPEFTMIPPVKES